MLHERPMHAYEIGVVLQRTGRGEVVNLRSNASLYQAMDRLARDGLIVSVGSEPGLGPKRKIYGLTETGEGAFRKAVVEMIAAPAIEFPDFPAALAFADGVPHAVLLRALNARRHALARGADQSGDAREAEASSSSLTERYAQAMRSAEMAFVEEQLDRLSRAAKLGPSRA